MTNVRIYGSKTLADALQVRPFTQRFPWFGPDLQTMKNNLTASSLNPVSGHRTRHLIPCPAGELSAVLNMPLRKNARAVVVMCPGLGGGEHSTYMREYAAALVPDGFATLRWNLRGAGPSAATSTAPYHAGLSEDLRAVLNNLPEPVAHLPIFLLGFSLGGHLILRTLGEGDVPAAVAGAVSVSAPLGLSSCMKMLEKKRNIPYMHYLTNKLKADLENDFSEVVDDLKNIRDLDDKVIAPAFGFDGAEDYYEKASARPLLSKIAKPILVMHSADDPWIPASDYTEANWPDNPKSATLLTERGGHVGFHGIGDDRSWAIDLTLRYFNHLNVFYG